MQSFTTVSSPSSWSGLRWATPTRVGRTSRRLTRASFLVVETMTAELRRQGTAATPIARARKLRWVTENLCALHGIQVITHGDVPTGPCALVSNHVSYLDPLAIVSQVAATAIAKREVSTWPVLGGAMDSMGVLWVNRGCPYSGASVLRAAARCWQEGVSVLAFPEGTTTLGHDVLPFRRGLFGAAVRVGVPVVPITLRYDDPAAPWVGGETFFPHYMKTASRPSTRVSLTFGHAIDT
ncbi:MAG: 1-acyl-sn-glycerol-3-phosphate acyltransferase, partial [Polyangiaceae bacterium]|nr:1-acyl-sn-glycerol-3-phosphate acyltransferase [Polyangiaceae bacterium]